jgi:drug/metabolite transporter (DMT)-like permease
MDAVGFALLAGCLLGGLAVLIRIGLRRAPDVTASAFVITFVGMLVTVAVAIGIGVRGVDVQLDELWPFLVIGIFVPGTARLLYVRAVRDAGPSRASILVGTAPILSALIAVAVLKETIGAAIVVGTLLIVAGGAALVRERVRPKEFKVVGLFLALFVAFLIAIRDNVARSVTSGNELEPVLEIAAVLAAASATAFIYLLIGSRGGAAFARSWRVGLVFLPMGVIAGFASLSVLEALDRGPVTVVAPLVATQALWVVVISKLVVGNSEAITTRVVAAAVCVVAGGALVGIGQQWSF